jgi:hypothetical protein
VKQKRLAEPFGRDRVTSERAIDQSGYRCRTHQAQHFAEADAVDRFID